MQVFSPGGLLLFLVFEGSSVGAVTEADRNYIYKVLCAEINIYSESGT